MYGMGSKKFPDFEKPSEEVIGTGKRQRPRLEQWEYAWLNGNVHVQRRICAHWRGIARVRKQRVERCCADVHCGSMRGVGVD